MDIQLANESSGVDAALAIYAAYKLRCIFLSGNLDDATQPGGPPVPANRLPGKTDLPVQLLWALGKAESVLA